MFEYNYTDVIRNS